MPYGTGCKTWGPANVRSFLGFKLLSHSPALIVTEPWSIQVA